MRLAICSIALVLGATGLVACGQSGDLKLANSTDSDKRAKYLLYSNDASKSDQVEKHAVDLKAPDQAVPASQANSN